MRTLNHAFDFQPTHAIMAREEDKSIEASKKFNAQLRQDVIARPIFEQRSIEEMLFDRRADLKGIVAQLGLSHLDKIVRSQLFKQIDYILDEEDWDQLDSFANPESFRTLVKFVLNTNPVQAPYLNLAPDGHLIATWIVQENRLRIECLSSGLIKWYVSCVIDGNPDEVVGKPIPLERLLDHLTLFKNAGWFKS